VKIEVKVGYGLHKVTALRLSVRTGSDHLPPLGIYYGIHRTMLDHLIVGLDVSPMCLQLLLAPLSSSESSFTRSYVEDDDGGIPRLYEL